jgi:hypothetical protein
VDPPNEKQVSGLHLLGTELIVIVAVYVFEQNVSIFLFESCSHQEFRPILHSLRLVTIASLCCAVILDTNWPQEDGVNPSTETV